MKNPIRVTIALDEESNDIFNRLRESSRLSQSEIIRRALKFYYAHRDFENYDFEKIRIYVEMLGEGEHVILDIDHLVVFLHMVETHPEKEKFMEIHREIARSHADQFAGKSVDYILRRLEACNFFRINKIGEKEYTLILVSKDTKEFVRVFLEEVLEGVGIKYEIKEDLTKLRLRLL